MVFETADMICFFFIFLSFSPLAARTILPCIFGWSHRSKNHEAKAKLYQPGERGGGYEIGV